MPFDFDLIQKVYKQIRKIDAARTMLSRSMTLAEKILYSRIWDRLPQTKHKRITDYVDFVPIVMICRTPYLHLVLSKTFRGLKLSSFF